MSNAREEKRYESLSPFELKNKLIDMATSHREKMMLNAGRGNPNWVATHARQGYFLLGNFALEQGRRVMQRPGLVGMPIADGMGARLTQFCSRQSAQSGARFLSDAYAYATEQLKLDGDSFIAEMVDGILGDHYPVPDRMLTHTEQIVRAYLDLTMWPDHRPSAVMDLYATEGGTAAMTYVFNTLKENYLLNPGDKIALGTPIFPPYLEIPPLNDYELVIVEVKQDENMQWQYPPEEIDKLLDPSIKAFFIVNPSNPTSVSMAGDSLEKIAALTTTQRPDLILLTDDVYATFVDDFCSLAAMAPRNTILVYSYSKYFGATGWRLGVIGIARNNVMDDLIAALPMEKRRGLHDRYASITTEPENLKIIDRMVADSRAVALNHTAGLSTPQQVMMALFSLQELLDAAQHKQYRQTVQNLVRERYRTLYDALGSPADNIAGHAKYYTTIDIPELARRRYGLAFASWLADTHEPIDFVWRLAQEKHVVLMDGGGFEAPEMSVRVSLANLGLAEYAKIGNAIAELLEDYSREWERA